jgi:Ca2+-binding RTX toxin-like protein
VQPATVADFNPTTDDFVFSNAGFDLGADNGKGTSTPQPIAASLFSSSSSNDAFTSSVQRFAYSMSSGNLYYSHDGNAGDAVLVANLSNHAALTAQDIMFTAHTA